jgi:N6-L-threonylcarbamoyladenine synthase
MKVLLAIETSCDDTGAAVINLDNGELLSNAVATQEVHAKYGGVVPELASRAHDEGIFPVVLQALDDANSSLEQVAAVAFTKGPGLIGALVVGAAFAKGLAIARNLPLIGVNHMRAHVLAHMIDAPKPDFPFLCLTVSGGHTQLIRVNGPFEFVLLGQTLDDAVGEAFDKAAKMLGLGYPGGPILDKLAESGNPMAFKLPQARVAGNDFSFSGFKTAVKVLIDRESSSNPRFVDENLPDLCASVRFALVDTLMKKLVAASNATGIKRLAIAGGVSANRELRRRLEALGNTNRYQTFIPKFEYCTDNAGMIAMTAWYHYQHELFENAAVKPNPRLSLDTEFLPLNKPSSES